MSFGPKIIEKELLELQTGLDERVKAEIGTVRFEKLKKYITKKEKALEKDKLPADKLALYVDGLFSSLDSNVLEAICNITENQIAKEGTALVSKFKLAIDQIPDKATQKDLKDRLDKLDEKDFAGPDVATFLADLKTSVTKELSSTLRQTNIAEKVDALCHYILQRKPLETTIEKKKKEIAKLPKKDVTKERRGRPPTAKPELTEEQTRAASRKLAQEEQIREGRKTKAQIKKEQEAQEVQELKAQQEKAIEVEEAAKAAELEKELTEAKDKLIVAQTEGLEKQAQELRETIDKIRTELKQLQPPKKGFVKAKTKRTKPIRPIKAKEGVKDEFELIPITTSKLKNRKTGAKIIINRIQASESCPADAEKFRILIKRANIQPDASKTFLSNLLTATSINGFTLATVFHREFGLREFVTLGEWQRVIGRYEVVGLKTILDEMVKKCSS